MSRSAVSSSKVSESVVGALLPHNGMRNRCVGVFKELPSTNKLHGLSEEDRLRLVLYLFAVSDDEIIAPEVKEQLADYARGVREVVKAARILGKALEKHRGDELLSMCLGAKCQASTQTQVDGLHDQLQQCLESLDKPGHEGTNIPLLLFWREASQLAFEALGSYYDADVAELHWYVKDYPDFKGETDSLTADAVRKKRQYLEGHTPLEAYLAMNAR